jgi:hypothetical protein
VIVRRDATGFVVETRDAADPTLRALPLTTTASRLRRD